MDGGTLTDCILWTNSAPAGTNWHNATLEYCNAWPLPPGDGNMDEDPRFVNGPAGDFRLLPDSPCIDRGSGAGAGVEDLEGRPRVLDGDDDGTAAVDMGCHEFLNALADSDGDGMGDGWELDNNFNPMRSSDAGGDADRDGAANVHECLAGTRPRDSSSRLALEGIARARQGGIVLRWQSVEGKRYSLYRTGDMSVDPLPVEANIPAVSPMNVLTDRTAVGEGPWFYRVGLE